MASKESHMYYNNERYGGDITYRGGPARETIRFRGKEFKHSQFCQCHLFRKLRGE